MKQLPIFLTLKARYCLVIGGDHSAQSKVELLLAAGALVHVNSDNITPDLRRLLRKGEITHSKSPIDTMLNSGYALVVIVECSDEYASHIAKQCKSLSIPVNVVDNPSIGSFTIPSIVDRDPITIAISTGGSSPAMASRIRTQIDRLVPRGTGALAELLGRYKPQVENKIAQPQRRAFWEKILDGNVGSKALSGDINAAERALQEILNNPSGCSPKTKAKLSIVDVRHNTPELLTLEAIQALHQADHIVHETDIHPGIIELARRDAQRHTERFVSYMNTTDLRSLCEKLESLAGGRHNVVFLASGAVFDSHSRQTIKRQIVAAGIDCREVQGVETQQYMEQQVS